MPHRELKERLHLLSRRGERASVFSHEKERFRIAAVVSSAATAKLMIFLILMAMVMAAEATDPFSAKILFHNMAQGDVTLKLLRASAEPLQDYITADMDTVPVVAQTGQWTAIGPFTTKSTIVHLSVAVASVKKTLAINLLKHFRYSELAAGGSGVVLTAVESCRLKSGKYLVIKLGNHDVALTFKM